MKRPLLLPGAAPSAAAGLSGCRPGNGWVLIEADAELKWNLPPSEN